MEFDKIDILELLPQRPPFIMVNALTHFDEALTCTRTTIAADNIFVENDAFTESGVIENIAQTCATRIGYINKFICNDNVKIGFIGMIRNLEITRLPKVGETLATQISLIDQVFQITLVNATVSIGDEIIASCEMKISIADMDEK